MDFKNFKDQGQKLGVGSSDYFKLEQGENRCRILTEAEPSITHFIGKGTKPAPCGPSPCQYCAKGLKHTVRVMLYLLDRKDETIKLAELPWTVYKALGELANSSEYGFAKLPPYDLTIIRTGEGMDTSYSVMPGRNETPVPKKILDELATKKPVLEIIAARKEQPMGVTEVPLPTEYSVDLPF